MNELLIYKILFWIMWLLAVLMYVGWRKSTKWWKKNTEEILDDWEKSSVNFLREYDFLQEKYNELLTECKNMANEYSAIEDDGR